MKNLSTMLLVATLVCIFTNPVLAQVATGSISGVITDANGASVPGAAVTTKDGATGREYKSVTSEGGVYLFPTLPPGIYQVTAEKTGFKKMLRAGVEVRIAARQELDLKMEVGEVMQTVEVTGEVPLLETTSSQRGQSLSSTFMTNLPLFTAGIRNPRSFVSFMPGVNNVVGEITVAGAGARAQEILIDGASATNPESGGTNFSFPAAEMFGEFKLVTGNFEAEYGRFGGGIEIYVTKSGTNDLHGTAFLNMRRDVWNANAWAFNRTGRARPKERFNEQGGGIGGPVYIPKVYDGRNKTFFFFTYTKDKRPVTASAALYTVPTALMKQGNFSQLTQMIYDPATTAGTVRTPFAGNIIPRNRFSTISGNMLSSIPDPTRASLTNNYDNENVSTLNRYIYNIKIDHAFSPGNRLAFTVTKETNVGDSLVAFPGPLGQGLFSPQRPDNWRFNHDLVIKPTMLLHSTYGYSRTRQFWDNPYQKGFASKFGFPGLTGKSDATPRVSFSGADLLTPWGVQDGKVADGSQINVTYHFTQGLSWVKGKHEFKIGWDIRRLQTLSDPLDLAGTNGQYAFSRAQTALPTNLAGTGYSFASMLLGLPDTANRVATPVVAGFVGHGYHAGYFQDSWKVTPRLTLSLGIRYDVAIGWHEKNGDYASMNKTLPNAAAGGLAGAYEFYGKGAGRTGSKRPYPMDFSNIGPRLGFAYRITPKTVLRGGYGIYYQTLGNGGCGCRTGFANPIVLASDGLSGALNWDAGITAPPGFRPPPLIDPTVANFTNADVLSPAFGNAPRIQTYSLNVQHEVGKFLVDVAYAATRGNGLNSTVMINQLPVARLGLGALLQQPITAPAVIAAGFRKPFESFPNNFSLAQSLRPYPQYFDVSDRATGIGRNWYDSMQAKVERRFGSWQLMGSYTFSKSLGLAHFRQIFSQNFGTSGYNIAAQDNYNYNEMKSYQPFDLPHVFNALVSYELPFGKGKQWLNSSKFVSDLVFGGWTVSGILRYQSGPLVLVQAPANTLGNGVLFTQFKKANVGTGPIRTGVDRGTLDPGNPSVRWFNAAAYTIPGNFELGNAAQYNGDFRNPPVLYENIGIQKRMRFPIKGERTVDLSYRADAFNAFNRTAFGGVNGTIGNASFGLPTGPQVGARAITMGLRLDF